MGVCMIAAIAESTDDVQSPMDCDRVSHVEQNDQTKEGDEMSALQNTVQLNHPVHEDSKHVVKHETDNMASVPWRRTVVPWRRTLCKCAASRRRKMLPFKKASVTVRRMIILKPWITMKRIKSHTRATNIQLLTCREYQTMHQS